jgi:hypothetical protein
VIKNGDTIEKTEIADDLNSNLHELARLSSEYFFAAQDSGKVRIFDISNVSSITEVEIAAPAGVSGFGNSISMLEGANVAITGSDSGNNIYVYNYSNYDPDNHKYSLVIQDDGTPGFGKEIAYLGNDKIVVGANGLVKIFDLVASLDGGNLIVENNLEVSKNVIADKFCNKNGNCIN